MSSEEIQVEKRNSRRAARAKAEEIVRKWTAGTVATGWVPGAGVFSCLGDQAMIGQIANCFEVRDWERDSLRAHVLCVAGSSLVGVAAEATLLFVPILGWAVKSAMLAGKVAAIGRAIIDYFDRRSQLPEC